MCGCVYIYLHVYMYMYMYMYIVTKRFSCFEFTYFFLSRISSIYIYTMCTYIFNTLVHRLACAP